MSEQTMGPLYPLTMRDDTRFEFCQWCGKGMDGNDGTWVHDGCVIYLISSEEGLLKTVLDDVSLRDDRSNIELAIAIQKRRKMAEKLLEELAWDLGAEVIPREGTSSRPG